MLTFRNALRRLLAVISLFGIDRAVARLHQRQTPTPPREAAAAAAPNPLHDEPSRKGPPYEAPPHERPDEPSCEETSYEESGDTEDTLAAWDTDRAERLHEAEQYEQQGLRLLAKAALLRVAIGCDGRGETFIAEELREHAQTLDSEYVDALSAEDVWEPTSTRFVPAHVVPADHGA